MSLTFSPSEYTRQIANISNIKNKDNAVLYVDSRLKHELNSTPIKQIDFSNTHKDYRIFPTGFMIGNTQLHAEYPQVFRILCLNWEVLAFHTTILSTAWPLRYSQVLTCVFYLLL